MEKVEAQSKKASEKLRKAEEKEKKAAEKMKRAQERERAAREKIRNAEKSAKDAQRKHAIVEEEIKAKEDGEAVFESSKGALVWACEEACCDGWMRGWGIKYRGSALSVVRAQYILALIHIPFPPNEPLFIFPCCVTNVVFCCSFCSEIDELKDNFVQPPPDSKACTVM